MSKFTTTLPTDTQAVLEMLPKGSFVHEIKLSESKRAIEIVWDTEELKTPYTFPVPYPLDNLSSGELPANVKKKEAPKVATPEPIATPNTETPKSTVDKPKRKR